MRTQTARVLALAFDPRVATSEDEISQQILDAALALAAASGLKNLTMDDVARRAGVGRMTVYRRFGSREALIDGLAIREARRCLRAIAAAPDPRAPLDERLADVFLATLKVIREHPLLERLARVEPEALLHELTRDDSAVFRLVREFLVGMIADERTDPAVLAELGVRLGASFVLIPDSALPLHDERQTRKVVRELIGRLLVTDSS
jgi:AcrR family transcriptional regulator